MRWPKGTTCWPAYAGTSETLSETLPKAVQRQRSSLTISTSCWTFLTKEAMELFLSDRKAMTQHQETMPRTRTHLWMMFHVKQERFEVWEVVDRVPPSTRLELERESSPEDERQRQLPGLAESHVRSGTADGPVQEDEPF